MAGKTDYVAGLQWHNPGINVNGKPHDLAFASERLRFKSN